MEFASLTGRKPVRCIWKGSPPEMSPSNWCPATHRDAWRLSHALGILGQESIARARHVVWLSGAGLSRCERRSEGCCLGAVNSRRRTSWWGAWWPVHARSRTPRRGAWQLLPYDCPGGAVGAVARAGEPT
eukprot:365643-Chlamydomonas_euryale.AAC.17